MDILIISAMDPFVTKAGGTRPYILNITKALSGKGINFFLWGVAYDTGKEVHPDFSFIPLVKKDISNYKFLIKIIRRILTKSIPKGMIIHAQRPDEMFPFILFRKKNPKIITIHGHNSEISLIYKKGVIIGTILKLIENFIVKRVDKIILVDERTKNFFLKNFTDLKDKMVVIPVSIDIDKFKPMDKQAMRKKYNFNKNDKILVFNGRFNKEKQLDILIESFKIVQKKLTNCKLIVIGDGPEKKNLLKLSESVDGITFTGLIQHELIPEILNVADVFVLCSLFEGMPTVVLESLACGVPVVSTDVGDVNKVVINGKSGYIVKDADPKEISNKIIKLLTSTKNYRAQCVQIAKGYSHELIGEKILGVYNEVLEN